MELLRNQLRQMLRRLRRAPMFTAVTMITLAAGVGANTVVFSVLEGVLLKPLPYPHSEQLVGIWHTAPGVNLKEVNAAPSNYFIYREQNQSFVDVGIYQHDSVSVTGIGEPEQVPALDVTDGVLPLLGAVPASGRLFNREDDSPGTPQTALISYGYWQHKFGGAPSAIGQNLRVDGESHQIIGILPKSFRFIDDQDEAIFLPLRFDRSKTFLGNFSYEALGRLEPGVTIEQASADVARMLPIVNQSFPAPPGFSAKLFEEAHFGPNLRPLKQDVVGDVGGTLWVLMGSIGLVLLIACANVANLLLVRVEGRRQELAVRAALGASRGRIAAELLSESVLLGMLSSVLGLGLAWIALRVLVAMAPSGLPRVQQIGIDLPVLLFTFGVAVIASLLFGAIPILKYAGIHLNTGIREGGRALSQSREQHRARSALVVVQVALALVLLICSGLMIRTFRAMVHVHPGFERPAEVQSFRIFIPESQVKEPASVIRMEQDIMQRLAAIPGVTSVGISTKIPMDFNRQMDLFYAQDKSYAEGEIPPLQRFVFISPEFLGTLGTPLVAGRSFTWSDTLQGTPVVMVSEKTARDYWGSPQNALGKRARVSSKDDWREVVGVVGDVRVDGPSQEPPATVYWPLLMNHFETEDVMVRRGVAFAVRSPRVGAESFLKDIREAVWSINPNLPLADVHTVEYYNRRSMARTSFTLVMLAAAGSMALLLGVVGIYGVIACSVSQRAREIGIRMALGAQDKVLTGMFVRHGLLLAGIGVACGLTAAFIVMRLMSSLLFHVNPVDPLTYAAVSLGLIGTAYLASYVPSRRASNVNPVEALRAE
jgi:predicted permease